MFTFGPSSRGRVEDPDNPDVIFANVGLLLHGEGSNGGTTITDSSSYAGVPGSVSNVTTSTTRSRYGSASIRSASDFATCKFPSSVAFRYAQTTTYEFSIWLDSTIFDNGSYGRVLSRDNSRFITLERSAAGTLTITPTGIGFGNFAVNITGSPWDQWLDICLVMDRPRGEKHYYLNGTRIYTGATADVWPPVPFTEGQAQPMNVVNLDTGGFDSGMNGLWMDEVRITHQVLHRAASYTLQGGPFSDS